MSRRTPGKKRSPHFHKGVFHQLDTAGESQNEFDEADERFEEYFACIMRPVEIHLGSAPVSDFAAYPLFEITYHNFPDYVYDSKGNLLLDKRALLAK